MHTKVRCTLVQALRLCTGRTARRGNRGIALLFLDHGTRRGLGVSVTPRPFFTPGEDPVPIVQEAGWAPGPVWTAAENLALTGIRSPDRPARSQSLLRLSYPAHIHIHIRELFSQLQPSVLFCFTTILKNLLLLSIINEYEILFSRLSYIFVYSRPVLLLVSENVYAST